MRFDWTKWIQRVWEDNEMTKGCKIAAVGEGERESRPD